MEPGVAYGYAGKTCRCTVPHKVQRPAYETFHTTIQPLAGISLTEYQKLVDELQKYKNKYGDL